MALKQGLPGGRLLRYFTPDYIRGLLALYGDLKELLQRERGLYEILDYETRIELLDDQGVMAHHTKRQRVKFLQDNVIAFQDYAWGDGENFVEYTCRPGTVVDRYKEGDRWNVLVSLRETKSRGDVEEFHIERTVRNAFIKSEEWVQIEIRHPTRRLCIEVVFPPGRHCQRPTVVERSQHKTTRLGSEFLHDLPTGQQLLRWEMTAINQLEVFTITWQW